MAELTEFPTFHGMALLGVVVCLAVFGRLYGRLRERARPSQPRQLGPYTLAEKIGEGATGVVYRARHAMLQRPCAIKVLSHAMSERALGRFEKEVQLTAQLSHPNTVSVYDYGRAADGTFYYVMELLDGLTLQDVVDRHGPQPPARVIHILLQLCAALREAHGAGLIHRDIKPENVLICRRGGVPDVAKLVDFGLVKQTASDVDAGDTANLLVGTPLYMSPEAIAAPQTVTARSDLYALGALAYFLLSGAPVFSGTTLIEVCSHHLHSKPERFPRVLGRAIPHDLERIVLDCLAKNPLDRPASAAELARRLERCGDAHDWSEGDAERSWRHPELAWERNPFHQVVGGLRELHSALETNRMCA